MFSEKTKDQVFHKILLVNDIPVSAWEQVSQEIPLLPKGWFELAHLSREDRILFTKEYWLLRLEDYIAHDGIFEKLNLFFSNMEDISIYAMQHIEKEGFDVKMVYSLRHAGCFFQGGPPALPISVEQLEKKFAGVLPEDYLAFLSIHDGFGNCEDVGLIATQDMAKSYQKFQQFLSMEERRHVGLSLDKVGLIPFYESADLYSYQCFSMNHIRPNGKMGNLSFSSSDLEKSKKESSDKSSKFSSFLAWFASYLEQE